MKRKLQSCLILVSLLGMSMVSTGCLTTLKGARNVGSEKEVWVYIQTSDVGKDGIYRCRDKGGKPVCVKAQVVD